MRANGSVPVSAEAQRPKARAPLCLHRRQQSVAGGSQTPVAEPAKLGLIHEKRSLPLRYGRVNPRLIHSGRGAHASRLQTLTRPPSNPLTKTQKNRFAVAGPR